MSLATESRRFLVQKHCTDWHGRILPSEYKEHLMPDCIIRVVVQADRGIEAIYLKLVRIESNGDLVGSVEDTYRSSSIDYGNNLQTGDLVTVKSEHINEIPLAGWQPDEYMEAVKNLKPAEEGFSVTGLRDLPDVKGVRDFPEDEDPLAIEGGTVQ